MKTFDEWWQSSELSALFMEPFQVRLAEAAFAAGRAEGVTEARELLEREQEAPILARRVQ